MSDLSPSTLREKIRRLQQRATEVLEVFESGPYSQLYDHVRSLDDQVTELQNGLEHQTEGASDVEVAISRKTHSANPISSS